MSWTSWRQDQHVQKKSNFRFWQIVPKDAESNWRGGPWWNSLLSNLLNLRQIERNLCSLVVESLTYITIKMIARKGTMFWYIQKNVNFLSKDDQNRHHIFIIICALLNVTLSHSSEINDFIFISKDSSWHFFYNLNKKRKLLN